MGEEDETASQCFTAGGYHSKHAKFVSHPSCSRSVEKPHVNSDAPPVDPSGDSPNPPYFDALLDRLARHDPHTSAAFGKHVHWGLWRQPPQGAISAAEYGLAAEALCAELCHVAAITNRQRILDVGCGFGGTIASLNERFHGLNMLGANIDVRQLRRAAKTVHPQNGNDIQWLACDAARLPLADASFDRVLAVECIFHFDRAAFLAEAARVLREGGSLTISDFVPDERMTEYLDAFDLAADEAIRWTYGQIDLRCSRERYHALADENALTLTEVRDVTRQTLPTYDFLRQTAADWDDRQAAETFNRATGRLEKASRKGLLRYEILRFEKPPAP
jgi:ubiquinone/menaquinone biosynthesis C-methylase UbiE